MQEKQNTKTRMPATPTNSVIIGTHSVMKKTATGDEELYKVQQIHEDYALQVYANEKDNQGVTEPCTWGNLTDRLCKPIVTLETMEQYDLMTEEEKKELKASAGGYIAGEVNGARKKENIASKWLITIDIDTATPETPATISEALNGVVYALHSTRSSRPNAPRYRLLMPLPKPVQGLYIGAITRYVADTLKTKGVTADECSYKPAQIMYFPTVSKNQEYEFYLQDNAETQRIDIDGAALYAMEQAERSAKKALPRWKRKGGYEKAFCDAYGIHEAIATFVPDTYIKTSVTDRRYLFNASESRTAGLYVFPDNTGAYSHHSTDPLYGTYINAYTMVLCHRYGGDVEAFHKYCTTDNEVMKHYKDAESWRDALKKNEDGTIKKTLNNIELFMLNDESLQGIGYNILNDSIDIVGVLPWEAHSKRWATQDTTMLRKYLENHGLNISKETAETDALNFIKINRRFDPLVAKLNDAHATYDGEKRAERLLIDYLGAEDTPYVRMCTRVMLLGAVWRAYKGGCKFDYVVTLKSKQGAGKSTLLLKLGGEYHTDNVPSMETEGQISLRNAWIVELAELSAVRKSDVEKVKDFLTRRIDKYRPKYDRNIVEYPRRCIFVATTNVHEMLKDPTGNRRFLPIDCKKKPAKNVDDLTDADIAHIWGEAVGWYEAGEKPLLTPEMEDYAEDTRAGHTEVPTAIANALEWLERPITVDWYSLTKNQRANIVYTNETSINGSPLIGARTFVSKQEIQTEYMKLGDRLPNTQESREVDAIWKHLQGKGWTPKKYRIGKDYSVGNNPICGLKRP